MARLIFKPPSGNNFLSTMINTGLLQLVMVAMVLAQRCTRAVPVQEYPAVKKSHVLRRIPAACSNWDKAWAWLTKVDCGTKYRLDYVTVPSLEVKQYKLQYVCCDGGTDCKEGEKTDNIHSSGFNSTDVKFLAIILGSTAACVVIIIIVLAITFYTRKTRCYSSCDQESHVYASADGDDSQDINRDNVKIHPEDFEGETDQKGTEVEYAEISDSRLPRYTDIFKETFENREDPFNRATAPPMYSAVDSNCYINSQERTFTSLCKSSRDGIEIVQANSQSPIEGPDSVFEEPRHTEHLVTSGKCDKDEDEADVLYYNVKEMKKTKKRSSSSYDGSTGSKKGEVRMKREHSNKGDRLQSNSRRGQTKSPVNVEMIVKSSSASESLGKTTKTALTKQKRRSAPPDSTGVGFILKNHGSTSYSVCSVSRSDSNSTCSVISEVISEPHRPSDTSRKTKSTRNNPQLKSIRKSSSGTSSQVSSRDYTTSNTDLSSTSGSIPPSSAVVLTCCDSMYNGQSMPVSELSSATEKDSLLRTPLCHSDCTSGQSSEGCEHCTNYDRLQYLPDHDAASLHIYQCLEDVKEECQKLREGLSSSSPQASSTKSEFDHGSKHSISVEKDYVDMVNKRQHTPDFC